MVTQHLRWRNRLPGISWSGRLIGTDRYLRGIALIIGILLFVTVVPTLAAATTPPAEPGTYRGTANSSDGTPAPVGTTIVATVNGTVQDTVTIDTRGEYGGTAFETEKLEVNATAGSSYVNFTVGDKSGPEALTSPVVHQSGDNIVNLTFPSGTFSAPLNVSINESQSNLTVSQAQNVTLAVSVENTVSESLSQTIDATVGGTIQDTESVTVPAGATEAISLTFPAEQSFDGQVVTVNSNKDSDTATLGVFTVTNFTTNHEFVGVVRDPATLELTADLPSNTTSYNGTVPVRFVRNGNVLYTVGDVSVTNGSLNTTVDPTTIPAETTTGAATVEIGGVAAGEVGLYHEVRSLPAGTHAVSVPQPAQLHVDGSFAATQWDAESKSYSEAELPANGDFSDLTSLHRGLYLVSDESIRVGYEFRTDEPGKPDFGERTVHTGWNLIGSHYDISSVSPPTLTDDLQSDPAAVAAPDGSSLTESDTIGPYQAYWAYSDSDEQRGIFPYTYNASARE